MRLYFPWEEYGEGYVKSTDEQLDMPPYPVNDEEILATCLERAKWWKKALLKLPDRGLACERHETYGLRKITGYTLRNEGSE
jgi:hypothetical protein